MMHAPDDIDIRSKMKESDRNHLETVSNNDDRPKFKLEGEGNNSIIIKFLILVIINIITYDRGITEL